MSRKTWGKPAEPVETKTGPETKVTDREILIITWGKSLHSYAKPPQSERNFDVRGVSYRNVSKGLDLRSIRGDDDELYSRISKTDRFSNFVESIINVIERNNHKTISINCAKGRHRSRAVARAVAELYPKSKLHHLDS